MTSKPQSKNYSPSAQADTPIVCHVVYSLDCGGVTTVVTNILDKQKNISVFSLRSYGTAMRFRDPRIFISPSRHKWSVLPLFALHQFVRDNKITVIHWHSATKSPLLIWIYTLIFKDEIRLIYHEHGAVHDPHTVGLTGLLYQFFLKHVANKVNTVIAVSSFTSRALTQKCQIPQNKIFVLQNFVDTSRFNTGKIDRIKVREKHSLDTSDFIVGFVGRIEENKGILELLSVAKLLVAQNPKISFVFAGNGGAENIVKKISMDQVFKKQVKFLGYTDKVQEIYSILDCFVLPSHEEACPMSILEAQSYGIPVISADFSSASELLENNHNALIFRKKDVLDLTDKIELLFSRPKLAKKLSQNGIANAKYHSASNYIKKLDQLYRTAKI